MPEPTSATDHAEPQLQSRAIEPKGVLNKNLKIYLYVGAALLLVVASIFSGKTKTPKAQAAVNGAPPQPLLQDTTESSVRDLKNELQDEKTRTQTEAQMRAAYAGVPNPDYAPGGRFYGCVPGQPCTAEMQQGNPQPQGDSAGFISPVKQQEMQIQSKEAELEHSSRFASNIVYIQQPPTQQAAGSQQQPEQPVLGQQNSASQSSVIRPHDAPKSHDDEHAEGGYKRPQEANIDSATGQPYLIYEDSFLDTVLM